jgi:hypothetical protein
MRMTTDDTDFHVTSRSTEVRRLVTLVVGSAEIIAFLLFSHLMLMSTDPLGEEIGVGMVLLIAVPIVLLTLPGLLLAWLGRAPRISLALVLAAIPVAIVAWIEA